MQEASRHCWLLMTVQLLLFFEGKVFAVYELVFNLGSNLQLVPGCISLLCSMGIYHGLPRHEEQNLADTGHRPHVVRAGVEVTRINGRVTAILLSRVRFVLPELNISL